MAVDFGIPFVRKHMISVLASDTERPNAAHTTAINDHSHQFPQLLERMRDDFGIVIIKHALARRLHD